MKRTPQTSSWCVQYASDKFDSACDDLRIIAADTTDHPQGPFTVATVNNTAPHSHHGIDAARLMAAAPALLEALMLWDLSEPMPHGARRKVKDAIAAATTRHIPDQRTDPFDEAHELYTHGATSGIADGDDNHIPSHE